MSTLVVLFELLEELKNVEVVVDNKNKVIRVKKEDEYIIELKFREHKYFELVKKLVKSLK
jgi:hypothetical protein